MSAGNWGGSAGGGGLDFQAAVSAMCMVHMACGTPVGWSSAPNDTPLSVSAETGGAGDDVGLLLVDGKTLEVQAKRKLSAGEDLWESLLAMCVRASRDPEFFGVLAVGPTSSGPVREELARDLIRIGQGRTDDLSGHGQTLITKLEKASIPTSSCAQIRIHTVYLLEQDAASAQAALAHLRAVTSDPPRAWERLVSEGRRLIRLRGRLDAGSLAAFLPGLLSTSTSAPTVIARQLLDWTTGKTEDFTIPGYRKPFSMDHQWLALSAIPHETATQSASTLQDALKHYHDGSSDRGRRRESDKFAAESLGYFYRHCVVVAGPGMGKSQLLRRMARLLARKQEPALVVRLRPLAERMRAGATFIEGVLELGLDGSTLSPSAVRSLGFESLTLLLDGLDEAAGQQDEIANAAIALTKAHPRCRVVVTTRPIGYDTGALGEWKHYEISPIDSSDAKRGVEKLVSAGGVAQSTSLTHATAAALRHLDYSRENKFTARSPLLVALLASLALNEVIAAETRVGLYGQLFSRIESVAKSKSADVAPPAVLNAFLHQLGWQINAQPYATADDLLRACSQTLAVELGEPPLKAEVVGHQALAFWEIAGIVERVRFKGVETLTFVHKTFGEYAAARFLFSRNSDKQAALVADIEHNQHWDEVLTFASDLGLASALVEVALEATQGGIDASGLRMLRWTKHSAEPLDSELAEAVLHHISPTVFGLHAGRAMQIGLALVSAASKLPGLYGRSTAFRASSQWWTSLVGWAVHAQLAREQLDFSELVAYMDGFRNIESTVRSHSGIVLDDPLRILWERLLLAAAKEAVRRGLDAPEQVFIERLEKSVGAHSMGFIGDLSYILEKAGIKLALPRDSALARYFDPDYLRKRRDEMVELLTAMMGEAEPSGESQHSLPASQRISASHQLHATVHLRSVACRQVSWRLRSSGDCCARCPLIRSRLVSIDQ